MILAHAFGQRYDLPIPLILFVLGGAVVVAVSFALVLPTRARPMHDTEPDEVPALRIRPVQATIGLLLLAGLIAAGIGGSQEVAENITPTAAWLVLWIVVPLSCGLIGDWTPAFNPYATLARLGDSARVRRVLLGSAEPVRWPAWLGWWPAVLTFFGIACGELVYNATATLPRLTGYALLVGALLSMTMGALFGAQPWLGRGEVFSVLFNTWGRLGYFRFGAPGRRGPFGGLVAAFSPAVSRVVFVMLLLISVAFDGLISTPAWKGVHNNLKDVAGGSPAGTDLLGMGCFAVLAMLMYAVFAAFAAAAARAGGQRGSVAGALSGLLPSLLPISFGYLFAHNLQYVVVNGQLLVPLVGNPVGLDGWQWLPAPFDDSFEPNRHILPSGAAWYVAVVVIVVVHVVAVVLAHRRFEAVHTDRARARRAEYPWVAAMIGYTMLSLWLLAQPLVQEHPANPEPSAAAGLR